MAYNHYMNTITLAQYVRSKLNMSVEEFAKQSGFPLRTLYNKWDSERGRIHLQDLVFRFYVKRFDDL